MTPRALALGLLALGLLACQRVADRAVATRPTPTPSASRTPSASPASPDSAFRCRSDDMCHPLRCDLATGDCASWPVCAEHAQCLPGWLCDGAVALGGGHGGARAGVCQKATCESDALDDTLRQRAPFHEAVTLAGSGSGTTFHAPGLTVCPNDYDRFRVAAPDSDSERVTLRLRVEPDLGPGLADLVLFVLSPVASDVGSGSSCATQSRTGHEVVVELPRDGCLLHGDADALSAVRFIEFYVQRAAGEAPEREGRYALMVEIDAGEVTP